MKILIITYNWPPRNSIGTHRPYSWAKHWAGKGASVTVLTSEKCSFDAPLGLALPAIPGVKVVSVHYWGARLQSSKKTSDARLPKRMAFWAVDYLKRARFFLSKALGLSIDVRGRWTRPAWSHAFELMSDNQFDVVVSTYGPAAAHRVAARLKACFPAVRWVADFRDLWSRNPTAGQSGLFPWLTTRLEKRLCSNADNITAVSAGIAEELASLHNSDVTVVPNGFDNPIAEVEKLLVGSTYAAESDLECISIVYTGNFYRGIQDPRPLFRAVRTLYDNQRIRSGAVRIDFYGGLQSGLSRLVKECRAESFVDLHGYVSRDVSIQLQRDASIVLLLEVLATKSGGILTGKLFEYMVSGTPVVCVGDGCDSELAQIIEDTGIGVSLGASEEKLQHAILDVVAAASPSWFSPNLAEIARYSRDATAGKMMQVISGPAKFK